MRGMLGPVAIHASRAGLQLPRIAAKRAHVRTLKDLKIGVALETAEGEARVALIPSNVETLKKRLVMAGHSDPDR